MVGDPKSELVSTEMKQIETQQEERERLADVAGRHLLTRVAVYLNRKCCDEEHWPPPDLWIDEYYYNGWTFVMHHENEVFPVPF